MNKKWSKKKKIVAAILIVIVLALVAAVLYIAFKPEDPIITQITEIETGDITETFDTTAIVQSGNQDSYEIFEGVKVNKVNVRVGDNVKKGDVLATFDTSSLRKVLNEKRNAYNTAYKAYSDYVNGANVASTQLTDISSQVAVLEKEIIALEKKVNAEKQSTAGNTGSASGEVSEKDLEELREAIKELLGNKKTSDRIIDSILSSGGSTAQMISALKGMLNSPSFDMSMLNSMTASIMSENEKLLIQKEFELVQLKVQESVLMTQSADALVSVYKTIAESAYESYLSLQSQYDEFSKGWVAKEDGFVREVNIKEGETVANASSSSAANLDITSILASVTSGNFDIADIVSSFAGQSKKGIVLEYYPLEATFEISKYDISKISMDQKVTVTTADGKKFDAKVNYISAVADSSSGGFNINSLMGSGGAATNTLAAKVVIDKADRSVIIGMDVELSAALETKKDVKLVPVEAIQYDNESGYYVFKYNADEEVIEKTSVVVGLFDGTNYEVIEGLEKGDQIVRAPSMVMKDGQRVLPG